MPVVVQKYGGETLNSPDKISLAVEHIREQVKRGDKIVAVVSAIGRKGEPYATDTLLNLLAEVPAIPENRELDLLLCCGELIAAVVFSHNLRIGRINAKARSGWEAGIITDEFHGNARILEVQPSTILRDLEQCDAVVVAGFQGMSEQGAITCLGRGGSDTSALALAAALHADRVEIIKDIPGVYTADPRHVPNALLLDIISAKDLKEMAWHGAKVLHPRAAELVEAFRIPVHVMKLSGEGTTRIVPAETIERSRCITGVAVIAPVCRCKLQLTGTEPQEEMTDLFETVARAGLSMDMFSLVDRSLWFIVAGEAAQALRITLTETASCFFLESGLAKVSIVGAAMQGVPGIMARFCRALQNCGVAILQTADSHSTISALVPIDQSGLAAQALHAAFIETPDGEC